MYHIAVKKNLLGLLPENKPTKHCLAKCRVECFYEDRATQERHFGYVLFVVDYYTRDEDGNYSPGYYLGVRPDGHVEGYHPVRREKFRTDKFRGLTRKRMHQELTQQFEHLIKRVLLSRKGAVI